MTSYTYVDHSTPATRGAGIKLSLTLLLALLGILLIVGYGAIPRTNHANQSHQDQAWNAAVISEYFDAGYCKPIIKDCPEEDRSYHYCKVKDKPFSVGLVIGLTEQVVITGFAARDNFWANRCPTGG